MSRGTDGTEAMEETHRNIGAAVPRKGAADGCSTKNRATDIQTKQFGQYATEGIQLNGFSARSILALLSSPGLTRLDRTMPAPDFKLITHQEYRR
jgi:hypothetical protein